MSNTPHYGPSPFVASPPLPVPLQLAPELSPQIILGNTYHLALQVQYSSSATHTQAHTRSR